MTVARELLASGDRRGIVLADLIIGSVRRERIEACRNRRQLERWLQKALLASEAAEIFGR